MQIGQWDSADAIPPNTSAYAVWDDWQKRRIRTWYFLYRKLRYRHIQTHDLNDINESASVRASSPETFYSAPGSPMPVSREVTEETLEEDEIIDLTMLESDGEFITGTTPFTQGPASSSKSGPPMFGTGPPDFDRNLTTTNSGSGSISPRKRRLSSRTSSESDQLLAGSRPKSITKRPRTSVPIRSGTAGQSSKSAIIVHSSSDHCRSALKQSSSDDESLSRSEREMSMSSTSSIRHISSPTPEPPVLNRRDSILRRRQEEAGLLSRSPIKRANAMEADSGESDDSDVEEDFQSLAGEPIPSPRKPVHPFIRPDTPPPPPNGFPDEAIPIDEYQITEETISRSSRLSIASSPVIAHSSILGSEASHALVFKQPLIGAMREWSPGTEASMTDVQSTRSRSTFADIREGMDWVDDDAVITPTENVAAASDILPLTSENATSGIAARILTGVARPPLTERIAGQNARINTPTLAERLAEPTANFDGKVQENIVVIPLLNRIGSAGDPEPRISGQGLPPRPAVSTPLLDRLQRTSIRVDTQLPSPAGFSTTSPSASPVSQVLSGGSLLHRLNGSPGGGSLIARMNRPAAVAPEPKTKSPTPSTLAERLALSREAARGISSDSETERTPTTTRTIAGHETDIFAALRSATTLVVGSSRGGPRGVRVMSSGDVRETTERNLLDRIQ